MITAETIDIKHIKKIQLFADFKDDAKLRIYILYGDKQESQPVYEGSGEGHKTIRIKPRKTAGYGFKIRMEGEGYVKLYALELLIESGGKLYAE